MSDVTLTWSISLVQSVGLTVHRTLTNSVFLEHCWVEQRGLQSTGPSNFILHLHFILTFICSYNHIFYSVKWIFLFTFGNDFLSWTHSAAVTVLEQKAQRLKHRMMFLLEPYWPIWLHYAAHKWSHLHRNYIKIKFLGSKTGFSPCLDQMVIIVNAVYVCGAVLTSLRPKVLYPQKSPYTHI